MSVKNIFAVMQNHNVLVHISRGHSECAFLFKLNQGQVQTS